MKTDKNDIVTIWTKENYEKMLKVLKALAEYDRQEKKK